ncbi:MAG: hypothetical protein JWR21_442 [Herminiimonas sp.]|nr:hypothetical protein [Herminiimonas sp.]
MARGLERVYHLFVLTVTGVQLDAHALAAANPSAGALRHTRAPNTPLKSAKTAPEIAARRTI